MRNLSELISYALREEYKKTFEPELNRLQQNLKNGISRGQIGLTIGKTIQEIHEQYSGNLTD